MLHEELSNLRLANQQVSQHRFTKPKELVAWMGAMQAQDYGMVRWAVGLRLPEPNIRSVQRAIDKGDIIRTHLMRPTWHLVSAKDVGWILDLTAPHIQTSAKSRMKALELSPAVLSKAMRVLDTTLATGDHLTRDELINALEKNKISARDQRASHILMWAELEKIICSGPLRGNKNTYAHFDTRVKAQKPIGRDEGLQKLARRYFASHGPATLQDFINWSGLPARDARKSLSLADKDLLSERIGASVYWFTKSTEVSTNDSLYLLPAFDEFIIGYKDRSACLSSLHRPSVISVNGILWPIIVFNGKVVGSWKKTLVKKQVNVQHKFFPATDLIKSNKFRTLLGEASESVRVFFSAGPAGASNE